MAKISEDAHQITGLTPYVPETMPKANTYKLTNKRNPAYQKNVVYFSTCANRAFRQNQGYDDTRSLQQVFESLCDKAGYNVIYPPHIENLCCGLSFENYEEICRRHKNILHAVMRYVTPPKDEQLKGIKAFLCREFQAEQVRNRDDRRQKSDRRICLQADGREFDWSMRGRYRMLQQKLTRR